MPLIFWTSPCAYTEGRLGYVDLFGAETMGKNPPTRAIATHRQVMSWQEGKMAEIGRDLVLSEFIELLQFLKSLITV